MPAPSVFDNQRLQGLLAGAVLTALIALAVLALRPTSEHGGGLTPQYDVHKSDEVQFVLEPFQSLEYKYLMDRGAALVFSWEADAALYFDLHAVNTTAANAEHSYAQGEATQQMGHYQAAFNGMHGWFWENRGFELVTLTLKTAGFYVNATEYRGGGNTNRSPAAVFQPPD